MYTDYFLAVFCKFSEIFPALFHDFNTTAGVGSPTWTFSGQPNTASTPQTPPTHLTTAWKFWR